MRPPPLQLGLGLSRRLGVTPAQTGFRRLHSAAADLANVVPVVGTGPPPEPPAPAAPAVVERAERVERRKRQAHLLKKAGVIRSAGDLKAASSKKTRFWKDVSVQLVDGFLEVHLDSRPLRHPQTKEVIRLPASKPNLAFALALEWDSMTSSQQATRQHMIPLTSLVCRALDIADDDATAGSTASTARKSIATTVMAYLDTDSLLCWAPPAGRHDRRDAEGRTLREVQKQTAEETISYLTTHLWPGIRIEPVLDGHSILPRRQDPGVREVVQAWVERLNAWDLAGLERAVLAGKSLAVAARLVAEWSEHATDPVPATAESPFGVEEAAQATSLEVDWQTGQWGEVEDTHDVNKEDVRRQLGSVILLVSGNGRS